MDEFRAPIYKDGGRLYQISTANDLTRDALLHAWLKEDKSLIDNKRAYTHDAERWIPGSWWINSLFAFRDGIIDLSTTDGGIVHDDKGAYAILLRTTDEVEGANAEAFTYSARADDNGRYLLTAGTESSRHPVRVLRSHNVMSQWAPRAGIRYEGL